MDTEESQQIARLTDEERRFILKFRSLAESEREKLIYMIEKESKAHNVLIFDDTENPPALV